MSLAETMTPLLAEEAVDPSAGYSERIDALVDGYRRLAERVAVLESTVQVLAADDDLDDVLDQ